MTAQGSAVRLVRGCGLCPWVDDGFRHVFADAAGGQRFFHRHCCAARHGCGWCSSQLATTARVTDADALLEALTDADRTWLYSHGWRDSRG